jgi:hypothetical protein
MENLNSVCYVGVIGSVVEIPGADNIELVLVNAWQAITKKGEYQVGDKVVVATMDAVIPEALSELMGVTNYLRKGQRVRTVKLRGMYSESLLIPFKYLAPKTLINNIKEGDDMMKILGVIKYEPPIKQVQLSSGRKIKYRDNPNFGVYYKFPNLKNVPGMFTEEDRVEITRKVHGTNARYGIVKKGKLSLMDKLKKFFRLGDEWIEYEYAYGSHNVEKGSDSNGFYSTDVWRTIAEKYNIKQKLWDYIKHFYTPSQVGAGVVLYDQYVFNNFIEGTKIPHEGIVIKQGSLSGERSKVAKVINPDYLIYGEKHNVGDSH